MAKQPKYRSVKQQEEMRSREEFRETFKPKKWYLLYDNTLTSENPYQGKNQLSNVVDERKRFLRETHRL